MSPKTFISFLLIAVVSALLSYRFIPAIRQFLIAVVVIFVAANAFWFWTRVTNKPLRSILLGIAIVVLSIIGIAYFIYWHEKQI